MNVERLTWRISSFSGDGENGGSCVEVAPVWRTSTFSGDGENGASCVEVAAIPDGIAVRDTKDRSRAPHTYSRRAWEALLTGVRAGEFEE